MQLNFLTPYSFVTLVKSSFGVVTSNDPTNTGKHDLRHFVLEQTLSTLSTQYKHRYPAGNRAWSLLVEAKFDNDIYTSHIMSIVAHSDQGRLFCLDQILSVISRRKPSETSNRSYLIEREWSKCTH